MRWIEALVGTMVAMTLAACGIDTAPGSPPTIDAPGLAGRGAPELGVVVAFDGHGARIAGVRHVGLAPEQPRPDADTLLVELRTPEGLLVRQSWAPDPRLGRSEEFHADGTVSAARVLAGAGAFEVRVPDVAGDILLIDDGAGGRTELARAHIERRPRGRRAQPLLKMPDDVVGAPVKVVDNGDAVYSADLLVVPEGYTESELEKFRDDVARLVEVMASEDGFGPYFGRFNVWRQDVRSRESGVDDPSLGIERDTAFDVGYGVGGVQRCTLPTTDEAYAALSQLATGVQADAVVVLVNDPGWGGCASAAQNLFASTLSSGHHVAGEVIVHELGHALFDLEDEYEEPGRACSHGQNVAVSPQPEALPWSDLLTTKELPTAPTAANATVVGAFEGGGYCAQGRYRAQLTCKMRDHEHGFCAACRRAIESYFGGTGPDSSYVNVTNVTGDFLYVRCGGNLGPSCTDWQLLGEGETATILAEGRRLLFDNKGATKAAHIFDWVSAIAPSDAVDVYANPTDPFTPPMQGLDYTQPTVDDLVPDDQAVQPEHSETVVSAHVADDQKLGKVELLWQSGSQSWTVDCAAPVEPFSCRKDETSVAQEDHGRIAVYEWRFPVGEGVRWWSIRATDAAGNVTESEQRFLYLGQGPDDLPPPPGYEDPIRIQSVYPDDDAVMPASSILQVEADVSGGASPLRVELVWESSDGGSWIVDCANAEAPFTCSESAGRYTWNVKVGTGTRTWYVAATDANGTAAGGAQRTIHLDESAAAEPPPGTCSYFCADHNYAPGQCYEHWYCDGVCLHENGC